LKIAIITNISPNVSCSNNDGVASCECNSGFYGDGSYCGLRWNGQTDVATYALAGGIWGATYPLENVFDDDTMSNWHSGKNYWITYGIDHASITVTFLKPVIFESVRFTAYFAAAQVRYQNLCFLLDGEEIECTPSDRSTAPFEVITIKAPTARTVTEVKIKFPYRTDTELAELDIIYKGILFRKRFSNILKFPLEFPCPSECWTFIDGRCDVKETCAAVTCSASDMTVSFNADLMLTFDNFDSPPALESVTIGELAVDGYTVSCTLGDCGMSYVIEDDKYVYFSYTRPVAWLHEISLYQVFRCNVLRNILFFIIKFLIIKKNL